MTNTEKKWTKIAEKMLVGRKIISVRYMSESERSGFAWSRRPIILMLDDGNLIYPSMDDEGNDGGILFTNNENEPVLPTL